MSGYGRFGLDYNEANSGSATGSTTLTSRLRLQFDMSTQTDGGVTFGARYRVQAESRDGAPGVGGFNGARFFVSANGFTLGVGNIIGAFEGASNLYAVANTPTADIGIDGAGFESLVANMAGVAFNWDAYSSAGAGVNGIEVIYSGGNWGVHVSYSDASTSAPLPAGTVGEKNTAISGFYTFGDWTIAAAHNSEDRPGALVDRDLTYLSVSGDLGFMNLTVNYAKGHDYRGAGLDSEKYGIYAGFDIGAATNVIVYVTSEDSPGLASDGTGYGFNVAHDLGGGVTLTAGARESSADNTTVQAGAYFRF